MPNLCWLLKKLKQILQNNVNEVREANSKKEGNLNDDFQVTLNTYRPEKFQKWVY